jgi:sugar phosphate isomerase/epimerase
MQTTRRALLKLAGTTACAAIATAAPKRVPVALQLYSLRDACKEDIARTLADVGKLKFQGVEWFDWGGSFGRKPAELRRMLDDNGLKSVSDHIGIPALTGDRFEQTVELHRTLGTPIITIAGLGGTKEQFATPQFWSDAGKKAAEFAAKLKPFGMRLAFHNHPEEFTPLADGSIPWELFFDNTGGSLIQQLDLGSVLRAGADPAKYLKRYPGRTALMHMKDYSPTNEKVLLGEGVMKWPEVLGLAETVGGIGWYIVEQESYPYPPLESVSRSFANLKKILAVRR